MDTSPDSLLDAPFAERRVADDGDAGASASAASRRLNTVVALAVALLSTFIGICKVKDVNLVQAMERAQADRADHWSCYQAKNVRAEVARATADELRTQAAGADATRAATTR